MTSESSIPAVGAAVREARQADGLGSRQLARLCGLSPGYLSRIENGQATPTAAKCFAVADALGRPRLPLAYLAGTVNAEFFLEESARGRRLLEGWDPDYDAILMQHLERRQIADVAHRLFVELSLADALEAIGFGGFDVPVIAAVGLTSQRLEAVEAFADEQRVLSDLDRRGANTAPRRLRGGLIDDEENARLRQLVDDGLNAGRAAPCSPPQKGPRIDEEAVAPTRVAHRVVSEVWPEHVFAGPRPAVAQVFRELPAIMRDALLVAAERPDTWISYAEIDAAIDKPRNTFARSFGGYRSKDPSRPRPLHIGTDPTDRFYLLVDAAQAAAIIGTRRGMSVAGVDRDPAAEPSYQALMTGARAPGHEQEES